MSNGFNFLLVTLAIVITTNLSWCQQPVPKLELTLGTGIFVYDRILSMNSGLPFGFSLAYRLNRFLQLSTAVAIDPARQTISTAATKLNTRVMVYNYNFNLRVAKPGAFFGLVQPFLLSGVGGILLNPSSVSVDVGAGERSRFDPGTDHKFAVNIGAGLALSLTRRLGFNLEYRRFFYNIVSPSSNVVEFGKKNASNSYWGMAFLAHF